MVGTLGKGRDAVSFAGSPQVLDGSNVALLWFTPSIAWRKLNK
jgi:hypothetical protein